MGKIDQEWLYRIEEPAIDPDRPIIDAHQHIWADRYQLYVEHFGRGAPGHFLREIERSGHHVVASVHCTIQASYNAQLPPVYDTVAETHYLDGVADVLADLTPKTPRLAAGIVGGVNMLAGDEAGVALDAHCAASGRFRGVRHPVAWHPSPLIPFKEEHAGILLEPSFQAACRQLADRGLVLDIFIFYNQLDEVAALADAVPGLTIILDHLGGPLTDPRFAGEADALWRAWQDGIRAVAARPNVHLKVSGMGMLPLAGDRWTGEPNPPTSDQHAAWMRPYVETAIEAFTPARAMCASNFPTERPSANYGIVWNSLKKNLMHHSDAEKQALFFENAKAIYKLAIE